MVLKPAESILRKDSGGVPAAPATPTHGIRRDEETVTNKVYCYHCMTYHQPETMRKMMTRSGVRWRCIRSIEATRGSLEERDAFGEQQSELNRAQARAYQESVMPGRRLATLSC